MRSSYVLYCWPGSVDGIATVPDITQHSQQTNVHAPAGFELTILASERQQTHSLDRAVNGIGQKKILRYSNKSMLTDLGRYLDEFKYKWFDETKYLQIQGGTQK
jgi:hypothetical protein